MSPLLLLAACARTWSVPATEPVVAAEPAPALFAEDGCAAGPEALPSLRWSLDCTPVPTDLDGACAQLVRAEVERIEGAAQGPDADLLRAHLDAQAQRVRELAGRREGPCGPGPQACATLASMLEGELAREDRAWWNERLPPSCPCPLDLAGSAAPASRGDLVRGSLSAEPAPVRHDAACSL